MIDISPRFMIDRLQGIIDDIEEGNYEEALIDLKDTFVTIADLYPWALTSQQKAMAKEFRRELSERRREVLKKLEALRKA